MKIDIKELIEFSKTLKILYVEDNEEAREQTLKLLVNFFNDIVVAIDGADGLEKFNNEKFDLILTDINMPKLNGIEMLKQIRDKDEEIPCIIISAHNEDNYFMETIRLSVDGYILKPIDFMQFSSSLRKTIEKIKLKNEDKNHTKELEIKVEQRTKELAKKLYFDDLTSVGSRYSLIEQLSTCNDEKMPILFLIDIDSLRTYNELYGVDVGNKILQQFAKLLEDYVKSSDYKVYRVSGDEFALFETTPFIDLEKYEETLNELFDFFSENKIYIKSIDEYIEIGITIGMSFGNENALAKANTALFEAKSVGKKFGAYNKYIDISKQLKNNIYWKKEIKSALDEDRVVPFFQPIIDREQKIIKYESLMRIKQYDEFGEEKIISPWNFIDIAIQTKQYDALSYRMIEKSIQSMRDKGVSVSVNLDYNDIYNNDLKDMFKREIKEFCKSNTNKIILEVLEDREIKDYKSFSKKLKRFRQIGALIAIDDFGSGYSNLAHVIGLEPHYIKIDATLVKDIDTNINSRKVVQSIVQLAKSLGIKTIAEFVSSKEIFDIVYELGADEFQGYYFGKPISIDEVK